MNCDDFLDGDAMKPGADLGSADRDHEGAYRRGYHQAIAEVMFVLKSGRQLTAEALAQWVDEDGMTWRKDTPLERMIAPPALPSN
jgi:hypothetical protein